MTELNSDRHLVHVKYFDRETMECKFEEDHYCIENTAYGLLQCLYRIRYLRQHEGINYSPHTHDIDIKIVSMNRREP